jgi:hypothetical protein
MYTSTSEGLYGKEGWRRSYVCHEATIAILMEYFSILCSSLFASAIVQSLAIGRLYYPRGVPGSEYPVEESKRLYLLRPISA